MDPQLTDVLVCPLCKGPLEKRTSDGALLCHADNLAFPVRDGIPVMLVEQATAIQAPTQNQA